MVVDAPHHYYWYCCRYYYQYCCLHSALVMEMQSEVGRQLLDEEQVIETWILSVKVILSHGAGVGSLDQAKEVLQSTRKQ